MSLRSSIYKGKKKKTRSEKRPFTLEKGKNLEKTSEKRKNLEKKNKQTNQIREEALYIREGEEPREKKKNKKQIRNRKREKIKTGVGGFEVSAWDHGWVDWLQIRVGHAVAWVMRGPGSRRTWIAPEPGSRAVVR